MMCYNSKYKINYNYQYSLKREEKNNSRVGEYQFKQKKKNDVFIQLESLMPFKKEPEYL